MNAPLRYSITSWEELSGCLSNTSRDLSLHIKTILHDRRLTGKLIVVRHADFGDIFVLPVDVKGDILDNSHFVEMSPNAICQALAGFGFYIDYRPRIKLPPEQLDYLLTVDKLGFNKIRVLSVKHDRCRNPFMKTHVVVFKTADNPKWLDNTYCSSQDEYYKALDEGSAMSLDLFNFNWHWLTFVGDIQHILQEAVGLESGWAH